MKKLTKIFAFVAAAATALASCDNELNAPLNKEAVTITVRPEVEALATDATPVAPASKTYIDGTQTILWGTGEYMKLAVTAGDATVFATSTEESADLFNGDAQALFEFSVTPGEASSYIYQGLYPASAAATTSNTDAASYKVNLPAIQNATATSYDPAAYIMVAKPKTFESVETDWLATFRRATALNKITLKNVPSGVSFNKVKITAEGKKLAGGRHFNLTTGEGLEVYGTDATVEVLYATAVSGTNIDVWFTSWDAEIAEGEKLTIIAYTTDSKSYTKEITARSEGIKFQEGYLNTLGVSLSGINPEVVPSVEDGTYVVLARKGSSEPYTYYALKGEPSGERIASVDYTGSLTNYIGDASLVWSIAASASSYTLKNGSNYLGVSAVKSASLIAEGSYDAEACLMSIEDQGNGTYKITNTNTSEWVLSRNTGNEYFAFYGNTQQYWQIVLVPATALETVATPTFSPAAGEVTSGTEVTISCATNGATIYYTTDGTDPTTSSTQGTSVTITAATTIKAIAVKEGMANSEVAEATYSIAGQTPTTGWIETAISDIASTDVFVIVGNNGSTYALSNDNGTSSAPSAVAVTVSGTTLTGTIGDNIKWNISGNATNGYTFYPSGSTTTWLYCTNSNNGVRVGDNTAKTFTISENGYLHHTGTSRYVGVYNSQDWRCYTSEGGNIANQVFKFYKYVSAPDTRAEAGMSWSKESTSASIEDGGVTFTAPTLSNPNSVSPVTYESTDTDVAEVSTAGEVTVKAGGETTIRAIFAGDDNYKPQTVEYTLTVTDNRTPVVSYDFETVAELNALVTATSAEYSGYLTDAVVSFVPATNTAIVKDATGSVMIYKSSHGLKQGQSYTGAINVTAIKYNSLYSEITVWDATFTGAEATVSPESVSLADLIDNYDDYQNAYVQVAGLTVSSVDGKNIHVTDGTNSYVVYDNTSSVSVSAGDVITAIGTITKYKTTEEIKVWKAADVTVTASAPKAITFSQPEAGGSFTVKVDGNAITSGTTVASGKTVTLTATAASGYSFNGWTVSGATVDDDSAAETTFTMGTSAVTVSASFTSTSGGGGNTPITTTITYEQFTNTSYNTSQSTFSLDDNTFGYINAMRNGSNNTPSGWAKNQVIQTKSTGYIYNTTSMGSISNIRVYIVANTNSFTVTSGASSQPTTNSVTRPTTATGTESITYSSYSNKTVIDGQSTTASYYDFAINNQPYFRIAPGGSLYIYKIEITYTPSN